MNLINRLETIKDSVITELTKLEDEKLNLETAKDYIRIFDLKCQIENVIKKEKEREEKENDNDVNA